MAGFSLRFCKKLIISSLLLAAGSVSVLCQNNLSGNLNQPKSHVSFIGSDRVIVDNVAGFAVNDTILLIQMQGVQILTAATYGFAQGKSGEPGMHEFMIILSINGGTREIVFRNDIINAYHIDGNIQIVRVPYYNSATVTGKLFCDPWNPVTKSGGVLAMIVARTLTLNSDIDVSGLGFAGGIDYRGDGICWNTNTALYGLEFYPESFLNAGYKGEGVANLNESNLPLGTNYMKGLGNNWTGGGGGNGRYSGGGGGSNRGAGGIGGFEDCFPAKAGGNGGVIADQFPFLLDRIYLGGGGGASTSSTALNLSNGGNGGGIVIIVADAIAGNGGNILADGSNGINKTGIGGSGGGGAGGSIALSLNNYGTSPIGFSIKGGNGGDNPGSFGEGGGGGGGLLYVSTNTSANATITKTGGTPGNGSESSASGGTAGEERPGFKAVLNGFLFNSISSSVTGNQVDSICSNMLPKRIIGTRPVGGTGPYTYLWEKSYNQTVWIPLANDADPVNYTPTVIETSTVWFRRTITDSSTPDVLVDISKAVQIIVQPFIKNNIVGSSDTLCYGQNPVLLSSRAVLLDGNGIYSFKWQVSTDNLNFNLPVNSSEGYTPPNGLIITSWYRRTVISGRCVDSTALAKLTVLPLISGNSITNAPPDICYGSSFQNITATIPPVLQGGDLTFRISWESSLNGTTGWTPAAGTLISGGFNPDETSASYPGSLYYRRVVKSGSNDVCVDNSAFVKLNDYPVLSNNAIKTNSVNKPICSGSAAPALIDSLIIAGGNNSYAYSWEYRTATLPWTAVAGVTTASYSPGALIVSTDFRRRVVSSACSGFSNIITITAHSPVLNNNISLLSSTADTTFCNGGNPSRLTGTVPTGGINSYAYLWLSSTDNVNWTQIPSASTLRDYDPPVLSTTTYYKRQVVSGACLVVSATTVNVNVLPLITNNIVTGTSSVCKNLVPAVLNGASPSGGSGSYTYLWEQSSDGGATWQSASLTNNTANYQPSALSIPMKYRRYVTSGLKNTCQSTSNVFDISIDPLPASSIDAGPDDDIFSIRKFYKMKAAEPVSGESGEWELPASGTFDNPLDNNATVKNLIIGKNSFIWTVHRDQCKLSDTVNIIVHEDVFPQGFSPNGDAYNNTFIIEGLDLDVYYADLRIVNGAGTEVYKTSNRNGEIYMSWDGKNNKGFELPEGTYYYMLKLSFKNDNVSDFTKSGFIILKRY